MPLIAAETALSCIDPAVPSITAAPEAVKDELRAGNTVNDFIIQDAEPMPQAEPVNLDFEQGVN